PVVLGQVSPCSASIFSITICTASSVKGRPQHSQNFWSLSKFEKPTHFSQTYGFPCLSHCPMCTHKPHLGLHSGHSLHTFSTCSRLTGRRAERASATASLS